MSTSISSVMSYFKNREEIFHSTVHESNFLIRSLFTSLVRRNLTLKSTFFSNSSYFFFFFLVSYLFLMSIRMLKDVSCKR